MAEDWFDIKKIKVAMKKAASNPISTAFGVGPKLEDGILAMHVKKSPQFLVKALKKEGFKSAKILVGTARTEGPVLVMTCEAEVPKAVKSVRYFLKENQLIQKKVRLIGPDGEFGAEDDEEGQVTDEAVSQPAAPDEDEDAFKRRFAQITPLVKKALADLGAGAKPVGVKFKQAHTLGQSGDFAGALALLDEVEELIDGGSVESSQSDPLEAEWTKRFKSFEPDLSSVLEQGLGDSSKLRAARDMAIEKAGSGDYATALKILDKLKPVVAKALNSAKPSGESEQAGAGKGKIAPGVAFTQSRLAWNGAREKIRADLSTLEKAIHDAAKDEDPKLFAEVKSKTSQLYDILGKRDEKLMDKLDEGLNAEKDSSAQLKAYGEASELVKDYVNFVNGSPLVQEIDSNPFKPVAVKKTLDMTLKVLASRLAA